MCVINEAASFTSASITDDKKPQVQKFVRKLTHRMARYIMPISAGADKHYVHVFWGSKFSFLMIRPIGISTKCYRLRPQITYINQIRIHGMQCFSRKGTYQVPPSINRDWIHHNPRTRNFSNNNSQRLRRRKYQISIM